MSRTPDTRILTTDNPSLLDTVDVVTCYPFEQYCCATEYHSFDDRLVQHFFIRVEFRAGDGFDEASFHAGSAKQVVSFNMRTELTAPGYRSQVAVMVSKADHCLNNLLYRQRIGQSSTDVVAMISNHPDLGPLVHRHGIPYHHFPPDPNDKPAREVRVWQVLEESGTKLVILARCMQVLSPELCQRLNGWATNIHHSLLSGSKGAKSYHQAYQKDVEPVGAIAYYINNDLDGEPIIAQGVETVDHAHYPKDLAAKSRDAECLTLARTVDYRVGRRVFLNASRTVALQARPLPPTPAGERVLGRGVLPTALRPE